ncbi:hypothetical protein LINPERPRIM_LOCUS37958 [Linum perenne]
METELLERMFLFEEPIQSTVLNR